MGTARRLTWAWRVRDGSDRVSSTISIPGILTSYRDHNPYWTNT